MAHFCHNDAGRVSIVELLQTEMNRTEKYYEKSSFTLQKKKKKRWLPISQSFLVFFSSDAAYFGYKSKTRFISVLLNVFCDP